RSTRNLVLWRTRSPRDTIIPRTGPGMEGLSCSFVPPPEAAAWFKVWKLPTTIGCAASNERFTLGYAVEAAA
ncbi:MAG: hypothetical protein IKG21_13780, partial [Atopobiaceae bacterium]|nr:hypothetical protein [Atopobiaceae bacterium]